jgi:hypothetical protein
MIPTQCINCRCYFDAELYSHCQSCPPHRIAARQKLAVCKTNRCGKYNSEGDKTGCTLAPGGPCKTFDHFLRGGGCLADKPLFAGIEKPKPKPIDLSPFVATSQANDIDLVTFHYNPARFGRLRETYYEWLPSLGPLASRLQCYELVFDDDEPEIDGSIVIRGTRERNTLWQKEAIMNVALRDSTTRYFAWIDHDLVLSNINWLSESIAKIDSGAVAVQLFSRLYRLSLDRTPIDTRDSVMAGSGNGSPGGAWIADRNFLDAIGGFETSNIFGGGDQTFYDVMRGRPGQHLKLYTAAMASHMKAWIERAVAVRGDRTASHIESDAYHLWHGEHINRQYATRHRLLHDHNFDPATDMRIGDNGLLEWCSDKPGLHAGVAKFFANRREDG